MAPGLWLEGSTQHRRRKGLAWAFVLQVVGVLCDMYCFFWNSQVVTPALSDAGSEVAGSEASAVQGFDDDPVATGM